MYIRFVVAALRVLKNGVLPKVMECDDFVVTFLDEGKKRIPPPSSSP